MTEIYKLARPLLRGVPCQILSGNVDDKIKNRMARDLLTGLPQFKGMIVVGNPVDPTCFERTEEFIDDPTLMQLFVFWVYDMRTTDSYALKDRLEMCRWMTATCGPTIQYVDHDLIESGKALETYIDKVVGQNYFPGIVLREPYGTFGTEDEELPKEALRPQ